MGSYGFSVRYLVGFIFIITLGHAPLYTEYIMSTQCWIFELIKDAFSKEDSAM